MTGSKATLRGRCLRAALLLLPVGLAALAIFGGTFGRGVAVGALGALALVAILFVLMRRLMARLAPQGYAPPPLPTAKWDYTLDATDLDGQPVRLDHFQGRIAILNFWGTWCAPCLAEMPSLFSLREMTVDSDIEFAFLSREGTDVLRKFIAKRGWSGPFYRIEGEPPDCFRTHAIPATFVIDRTGTIVMRHFGAARWDDDNVVRFLHGLAATP